jgi:DNA-binding MurR/RpiR family transcriptional regulator
MQEVALRVNGMQMQAEIEPGELVRQHFDSLTKSEKRIARYLLRNQDEVAFLSAAELAARLGLSEATTVRFAQSLGFSGYPDMRAALQSSFRSRVTHSVRLRARLGNLREEGDIFERLTSSEIDHLTQALRTVDRNAIHQAVNLLRERERVFVFGIGPAISLVDLLEIRLRRFGRHVIPLTTTGREMLEPLLLMTGADLLFAIGFFDVTPALQLALDHARACGCVSILLTDTLGSIIGNKADVVLAARRGPISAFHSLTVPMTIINTLLLALAQTDQERAMSNLDKLDELRRTYALTVEG